MLKVPTTIDDLLKDSIVEIRFNSQVDFALIPGLIYSQLIEKGYTYTGAVSDPFQQTTSQIIFNFGIAQPTFSNESITCRFNANALIFNCKGKYIGWKKYYLEILTLLKIVDGINIARSYSRVGLRYINILKDTNIYEKLVEDLRINLKSHKNVATNIKTEIIDSKFKINVNLGNDFRMQDSVEKVSVIDIDVFFEGEIKDLDTLLSILDEIHSKEKEIFFSFLKPEYIETLNPKYER